MLTSCPQSLNTKVQSSLGDGKQIHTGQIQHMHTYIYIHIYIYIYTGLYNANFACAQAFYLLFYNPPPSHPPSCTTTQHTNTHGDNMYTIRSSVSCVSHYFPLFPITQQPSQHWICHQSSSARNDTGHPG